MKNLLLITITALLFACSSSDDDGIFRYEADDSTYNMFIGKWHWVEYYYTESANYLDIPSENMGFIFYDNRTYSSYIDNYLSPPESLKIIMEEKTLDNGAKTIGIYLTINDLYNGEECAIGIFKDWLTIFHTVEGKKEIRRYHRE